MVKQADFEIALRQGFYEGSSQDRADGFIHFSSAEQIEASAAKHRAGETDLVLLIVDAAKLGLALRWEVSRGGALFPHLYGALPTGAIVSSVPLPLDAAGRHVFPKNFAVAR